MATTTASAPTKGEYCKECGCNWWPHFCSPPEEDLWSKVFDLLILARNSKDEDALQEAIDIAAEQSCRSPDF